MSRVLVVEDESTSQTIFRNAVQRLGHEAIVCGNGMEAMMMLLDERSFDVLIVDVILPGMDGRYLVRRVRTHTCLRDVPIIMTSGVVGPKEIGNLLDMGVTMFISKPVALKMLEMYIVQCLNHRSSTSGKDFRTGLEHLTGCRSRSA